MQKNLSSHFFDLDIVNPLGRGALGKFRSPLFTHLNEIPAQIRVKMNVFLAILADSSADCAVLWVAQQRTGLRTRRFDRLEF